MAQCDGQACPGCGLPNFAGFCPYCSGDQDAYEQELSPPFPSSRTFEMEDDGDQEGGE